MQFFLKQNAAGLYIFHVCIQNNILYKKLENREYHPLEYWHNS